MNASVNATNTLDGLTFEQAYDQLTTIIRQLDEGSLTLDEAVTLFERGRALTAYCQLLLDQAELRISQLPTPTAGE